MHNYSFVSYFHHIDTLLRITFLCNINFLLRFVIIQQNIVLHHIFLTKFNYVRKNYCIMWKMELLYNQLIFKIDLRFMLHLFLDYLNFQRMTISFI